MTDDKKNQTSSFRERMIAQHARIVDAMRKLDRFDIGVHKGTKLVKSVGRKLAKTTLLDKKISEKHAARLQKQFVRRWGTLTKEEMLERLRLWTVLHSVCEVDENPIAGHVDAMKHALATACISVKGIEVIGVVEIEIVNLGLMRQYALSGNDDDEARKLLVIEAMMNRQISNGHLDEGDQDRCLALVHFHGVVDLGTNVEGKLKTISNASRSEWKEAYQVQFGGFHSRKTVASNLKFIARYLVKGGNEALIYKFGFGWDKVERLEARMLKTGKVAMGSDFEGYVNDMSLAKTEIAVLVRTIDRMMCSSGSRMRNGYIWKHGQQIRYL
jgi:hypothetical protein